MDKWLIRAVGIALIIAVISLTALVVWLVITTIADLRM